MIWFSSMLKAQFVIIQNIRALLSVRKHSSKELATYCNHASPWISKILSGERGVQCADLDQIANFFGITVSDLFQHGISPLLERRVLQRRNGIERRVRKPIIERRAPSKPPTHQAPNHHRGANKKR